MFATIYTSMSGLLGFGRGLDVISTNVANVNTPGYKGTEVTFRDVLYDYTLQDERNGELYGSWIGHGVAADLTSLRFNQGEFRDSGNDTDAAIDGKGFFVIDHDGEYVYTRAGQFDFDDAGILVTRNGQYRVMGLGEDGTLQAITLDGLKTQPAKPTGEVTFIGNLSLGSSQHVINSMRVVDTLGRTQTLSVRFTNNGTNTPRSWRIEVRDSDDDIVATGGEIRFQGNGSPEAGHNTFTFEYTAPDAAAQQITLNFGEPDSFSQATSFSGSSSSDLAVDDNDGHAQGSLLKVTFNESGELTASYSNNQTATGARLALASFNNLQALQQLQDGLFRAQPQQQPAFGQAGKDSFGSIAPGRVELSNVELSQQFTDMIVIQRGYQASSQVLTVANEMMQQILEATK